MESGFYTIFYDDKCMIYNKKNKKLVIWVTMTNNRIFQIIFFKCSMNTFNIQSCNFTYVFVESPCFKKISSTKEIYKAKHKKAIKKNQIWNLCKDLGHHPKRLTFWWSCQNPYIFKTIMLESKQQRIAAQQRIVSNCTNKQIKEKGENTKI